jgi:hypothetical protein
MGKNIAAGVAGVLIAFGLAWLVEMIGHSVYPPPADIDFSDADAMRTYVAGLPLGALLFVAGAWSIGAFAGTIAACRIGTANPKIFAMVVGGMVLVATAFNLAIIPHPLWFSIAGIVGIIVAAWLGMTLSTQSDSDD